MPVYTKDNIKVLHIHTPKTGGTSVMKMFEDSGYITSLYNPEDSSMGCTPQHYHKDLIYKLLSKQTFAFCFSLYRDPIERLISQYKWEIKHVTRKYMKINDWIPRTFNRYRDNPFIQDNHIRPQSEFFIKEAVVYDFNNLSSIKSRLPDRLKLNDKQIGHAHKMTVSSNHLQISDENLLLAKEFYKSDYDWIKNHKLL